MRRSSDGQENGTSVPGLTVPKKYLRTYTSIPQVGLDNRTSPLYTGAGVGGGTVVNGMFFNRGSASDYNAWEKLGNPGWGWKDLLPYFKKVGVAIFDHCCGSHMFLTSCLERDIHTTIQGDTEGVSCSHFG